MMFRVHAYPNSLHALCFSKIPVLLVNNWCRSGFAWFLVFGERLSFLYPFTV
ncbi:hypothetical protein GLYMA_09G245100v4 [Glycine max]|uniref:Uncharacterized protein n=1 Tax=Glycine max TaxID=3847 RepID=K7LFW2_SOYBN|nr:hypothetical protein JHK85_026694 [Glycine max]KAG5013949.1 hypothetical protein JHK86_026210 [Glycine max]KAH1044608.1 hypothetical protein GYH30_026064 [Glycine max]KRH40213.1 hypothetical protein GLYMA_09G245100v4 [Glycine max]